MNPLAAFQVLVLAMAAAMAVEAVKPTYTRQWRVVFWLLFAVLGVIGITSNQIAAAWPDASSFMVWVGSSPVTLFLAFVAWIIILQKPWRRPPAPPPPYDDTALRGEIAELNTVLEVGLEMGRKEAAEGIKRLGAGLVERIEAAKATAQGARDYAEGTNHSVSETLGTLEKEQRLFIQRMETWVGNLRREIRLGFKGVDQGFAAIYARERLLEMAYDLTEVGDRLTAPSRGEALGEWAEWESTAGAWHKAVEAWARLAEKYRVGTVERVFDVPPSEYKKNWRVEDYSIFPGHEAIHEYKTLCIISRNFHVERKSVDQYMLSKAFERPSMKPVLTMADLRDIEDGEPPASPPPPKVQP
jgi:hypothetical protein